VLQSDLTIKKFVYNNYQQLLEHGSGLKYMKNVDSHPHLIWTPLT